MYDTEFGLRQDCARTSSAIPTHSEQYPRTEVCEVCAVTPKYVYVKYVEGPGSVFSMRTDSTIVAHIGPARQSYR